MGDTRALERSYARAARSTREFGRDMDRTGRGAIAASLSFKNLGRSVAFASTQFLAGAGLVAGVKSAVNAASDLNEQVGKTDVVFGESSRSIEEWAKTTTDAFGLSQRQALTYASTFGALFRPLGIGVAEAARQSQRLTQLGADLASFYNTSVQDALDAIKSGIVGEAEPLRRYGVLLSEARVQQEAMNETGKTTASQLTAQEKALARVALIFRDTTNAQGDYSRSSGRLAGQTKELQARVDDLQVKLGQLLVPALTNVVTGLNEAADAAIKFGDAIGDLGDQHVPLLGKSLKELGGDLARNLPLLGPTVQLFESMGDALSRLNEQVIPATGDRPSIFGGLTDGLKKLNDAAKQGGPFGDAKPLPVVKALSTALQTAEVDARLSGSRSKLRAVLERQAAYLRDALVNSYGLKPKDKLAIKQALLGIVDEVRSIDQAIADEMQSAADKQKQAAEDRARALKDAAEKARKAAKEAAAKLRQAADEIKSAVLERLDMRQTNIQNERALRDAVKQLALARQLGGPEGIRLAQQAVADARMSMLRARIEAAPATLTGQRFQLGGVVTINVHGTTDPEQVARKVVAVLQRSGRHTSTQQRGPAAATYNGPH